MWKGELQILHTLLSIKPLLLCPDLWKTLYLQKILFICSYLALRKLAVNKGIKLAAKLSHFSDSCHHLCPGFGRIFDCISRLAPLLLNTHLHFFPPDAPEITRTTILGLLLQPSASPNSSARQWPAQWRTTMEDTKYF